MPSPERPGEEHRQQEEEALPYYEAARFAGEEPASQAYFRAQEAIFKAPKSELSAYRLHLNQIWHVVVLGDQPPNNLKQNIKTILSTGEPVSLQADILNILKDRRDKTIKQGPWVERHHRPGKHL